jgi:hypothetical protein
MRTRRVGTLCIIGLCAIWVRAESQPAQGILVPVEAELMAHLRARTLKQGDLVYARVAAEWSGPGCLLRRGATLEAKIVGVTPHSPKSRDSTVSLSFTRAQCGKTNVEPFMLVLAAVAAPDDADSGNVSTDLPMVFGGNTGPSAPSAGLLRSSLAEVDPMLVNLHRFPVTPSLHAGDVLGISGMKLSVGTGPENSSSLTCSGHDLELDQHTRFLLVPASITVAKASSGASPQPAVPSAGLLATRSADPATAEPVVDELDTCVPPACNLAASTDEASVESEMQADVSINVLGYSPRLQTEMEEPGHDDAIAYLSPTQLLVTFNPHRLVPRHGAEMPGATVRLIRAAVIDTTSRKVVRSVEWHLPDKKQYLWTVARQRVLVHVGNELRVYGPGLTVEARITLTGPLAFVRPSPDGKILAVGVIKERHTYELHAKLRDSIGQEPEEDIDILVLNEEFQTIASAASTSDRLPPTLLNEGQVKLLRESGQPEQQEKHYRLELRTWDNLARNLGKFTSGCTPQVSSLSPDLVLLVTCDKANQSRNYRVLRPDGTLVLRGQSLLKELGHAAVGDAESNEFVIRVFEADEPVLPGEVYRGANLKSAQLEVYRSDNGKHIFSVRVSDPAASSGGYALSPGGGQLAILTRDSVALYTMHPD